MSTNNIYDFMNGEKYEIKTIPFDKLLTELMDYPGIYSWHIRPKKGREFEIVPLISALLSQTQLKATVEGNIRFRYSGSLKKEPPGIGDVDPALLRSGFILAQFPLYIGISKNLKNRLTTHYNHLLDQSDQTSREAIEDKHDDFADRITKVFREANVTSLTALYVRVFEVKDYGKSTELSERKLKSIKKELENIETILNTAFNPVFGRR
jgi:hypothetical protein